MCYVYTNAQKLDVENSPLDTVSTSVPPTVLCNKFIFISKVLIITCIKFPTNTVTSQHTHD